MATTDCKLHPAGMDTDIARLRYVSSRYPQPQGLQLVPLSMVLLDLIRFGGRVDRRRESTGLGGVRISIRCSPMNAGEHPVAI